MLEVAKKAALVAGKKVFSLYKKRHKYTQKKKFLGDFSTEADLLSESEILRILKKKFPGHNFISEELGRQYNKSEYSWVIDPLDGTIPFSNGLPTFGISIGLLKGGSPLVGVIYLPYYDSLYWAEKSRGAYKNGRRIRVSKKKNLGESVLAFGLAYRGMRKIEINKLLIPLADKVRYPPIIDSSVVALCYVAEGKYEGYLHWAHNWDFVAGAVLVEEAGGKVIGIEKSIIDWSADWIGVFVSNGLISNKVLSFIRK